MDIEKEKEEIYMNETINKRPIFKMPVFREASKNFGIESMMFIREDCEGLLHDAELDKIEGMYNFNRDTDKLCLENAIFRFLETGSREDAFDIYFIYCEMFKPFGEGYQATRILLEMLSEHEENSSSLLMKHRDHYSHSVYAFLLGLAIYRNNRVIRDAYNEKYNVEGAKACHHFIEYWGMTSLFHDIGYPFEIAHQQMKVYVCKLAGKENYEIDGVGEFAPFVSYKHMDDFTHVEMGGKSVDLNEIFAKAIVERIGDKYEAASDEAELVEFLRQRAVNDNYKECKRAPYLFMDHAYFSGLIMMKKYIEAHADIKEIPNEIADAFVSIMLHNSMFKFGLRGKQEGLGIEDKQPLTFLLMLCDELQCWDRTSYGQNSRNDIFPFEFDIQFKKEDGKEKIVWTYFFDDEYEEQALEAKSYKALQYGYTKKNGTVIDDSWKFKDDIDEIVKINCGEFDITVEAKLTEKEKKTGRYASDTSYLNLYDFALALNARYDDSIDINTETMSTEAIQVIKKQMEKSFAGLTLEFKLSNIAQAKNFAKHLELIKCFYTNKAVDYEMVREFTPFEVKKLAEAEHKRWCDEKLEMGWVYGTDYKDNKERAKIREHRDLVEFNKLGKADKDKDSEPMKVMIKLLKIFDGLNIYRI